MNKPENPDDELVKLTHFIPRGLLRFIVLKMFESGDMTGTEISQFLEKNAGGLWKPSPGTIYPLLAGLENEGLVKRIGVGGRTRVYQLSDTGRKLLKSVKSKRQPWLDKAYTAPLFWVSLMDDDDQVESYIQFLIIIIEKISEMSDTIQNKHREKLLDNIDEAIKSMKSLRDSFEP